MTVVSFLVVFQAIQSVMTKGVLEVVEILGS